ncbi:MAG: mechanosensitive ion channel [Coxiellaceae bacterium]|nr:mechanosensitive ion channel [Coxiellaceae bacterium]
MNWLEYIHINGLNTLYALLILSIGLLVANVIKKWLRTTIRLKSKDPTVKLFVINAVYSLAIVLISISSLTRLGVPTASLLTVLGAASLAIGLSLKDSLSNVASGLIIIGTKPFHIGDVVEINGVIGTVDQINLLNIRIKTANSDSIVIPNSKVLNDKVCTKGIKGLRRLDITIGISYDADIATAKTLIKQLFSENTLILKTPEPAVAVKELADSAVLLAVRPWVNKGDYTTVLYALTEAIKLTFDKNNIKIPYPQLETHVNYTDTQTSVNTESNQQQQLEKI